MTVKERSCSFYNLLVNLWCFNNDNIHNFRNIFSVNLYAKNGARSISFIFSKGIDFNDMSGRCFCSFFFLAVDTKFLFSSHEPAKVPTAQHTK